MNETVACCTSNTTTSCCSPAVTGPTDSSEAMTLGAFRDALETARGSALSFSYDGRTTKPGYHVTELKFARVTGLDCGANVESWSETIFQLWDIEVSVTGQTMTVDKLIGVISKYASLLGAETNSKISFEVSDGEEAMRIFALGNIEATAGRATIHLVRRASACKPLVRGILSPQSGISPCGPKIAFADDFAKTRCCG